MSTEKIALPKALPEIPYDQINEATKSYETVSMRVTRRNDRGVLATVYNRVPKATRELPEIDGWLSEKAGGGRYTIYAADPANPANLVLPPFEVTVEGPPRVPINLDSPYGSVGSYSSPQHQAPMPPSWAGGGASDPLAAGGYEPPLPGYGHDQQHQRPRRERPAPGATFASDQILMQQVAERDRMLERLQREAAERDRLRDAETKRLQTELDRQREDAREARHKAEMDLLRAEIRNGRGNEQKGFDLDGLAKIIAAVAPMFIGKQDAMTQGLQMQQAAMQQTMQLALSTAQRPSEISTFMREYGPMLLPALKDMFATAKGNPEKEAQLIQALAGQQMENVAMMAQLVGEFAIDKTGEDHPIVDIIQKGLQGAVAMGQAYIAQRQEEAASVQVRGQVVEERQMPAQAAPQQQTQPHAPRVAPALAGQAAQLEPILAMLPQNLQTHEWRSLLIALHRPEAEVEEMATLIAHHVQHLVVFQMVPPELQEMLRDPRGAMGGLLRFLPAAQVRPDFVQAVVERVAQLLEEANIVQKPQPVAARANGNGNGHRPRPAPAHTQPPEEDDGGDEPDDDESDAEIQTYPQA